MSTPARRRMSLLDSAFLRIEKRESPMHVASLQVFRIPEGADDGFIRELVKTFRAEQPLTGPFGLTLADGPLSRLAPSLVATNPDFEYHIRHSALPAPGGERELGELVSHLHGVALDRSRPLWTCHVIEGLQGNRFAIYFKIHHALTDGVGGMRLMTQSLASEPNGAWSAPWHYRPDRSAGAAQRSANARTETRLATGLSLARGFAGLARRKGAEPVALPFGAPHSAINAAITGARRVATQQVELARLKSVGRQADASVNDVFLAICSTALRRHLNDSGLLPERSLVAGVPVSLRQPGDTGANAVGTMWSTLGTDVSDPLARLRAIHESMVASKTHLNSMSPSARKTFTTVTMTPVIAVLIGGLGAKVRPPMNVTISNVPGPKEPVYLNGARLEAFYPVSIPVPGQALNITCVTYDGKFNIGFTGCRDSLPHLQRLAVYAGEALDELEAALARPGRKTTRKPILEAVS
jgi:diacylglycerol O-acyltransferase